MNPQVRLKELTAEEVLGPNMPGISESWISADEYRLNRILPLHAEHDAFRFLAATAEDGRLAGFAYGYVGAPGQWWYDIVSKEMDAEARRRWLPDDHFEFTELHVHPDFRRRGIGGRLHDALLDGIASPTAVLTTQTDNGPALTLYGGRGWKAVVPELFFYTDPDRAFCLMGKDLG